ncbi:unnamed protein product [Rhizoctonia solani]|uniref:Uncharacterized protein n=1 Tax=Rhizoctonia solani TaxID=456999 RepID=A0A8H2XXE1_9AGAM|nr:unnamed protein product [Rhizoctonia solani]
MSITQLGVVQPQTLAGTSSMPGKESLPFFAVEYNCRRVGIRRSADYDGTINSVQNAFPELAEISKSRILLAQVFPELGTEAVEIGRELWKDVLPLVKTMQVVLTNVDLPEKPKPPSYKRQKTHGSDGPPKTSGLRILTPHETGFSPSPVNVRRVSSSDSFWGFGAFAPENTST